MCINIGYCFVNRECIYLQKKIAGSDEDKLIVKNRLRLKKNIIFNYFFLPLTHKSRKMFALLLNG